MRLINPQLAGKGASVPKLTRTEAHAMAVEWTASSKAELPILGDMQSIFNLAGGVPTSLANGAASKLKGLTTEQWRKVVPTYGDAPCASSSSSSSPPSSSIGEAIGAGIAKGMRAAHESPNTTDAAGLEWKKKLDRIKSSISKALQEDPKLFPPPQAGTQIINIKERAKIYRKYKAQIHEPLQKILMNPKGEKHQFALNAINLAELEFDAVEKARLLQCVVCDNLPQVIERAVDDKNTEDEFSQSQETPMDDDNE